jgi:diguanylate cyclase (GGDEF)-like protein
VPETQPDGSVLWHGYFIDITEKKRAEARIHDLAFRDALTGLPNRAALMDEASEALAAGAAAQRWSAVLYVDLDQFKMLNDTKGHQFGDRLLAAVAERMKPVVSEDGLLARLGGDEFVVLVKDIGRSHAAAELQARRIAESLQTVIRDPFVLDGFPCHISASVGIALASGGAAGIDEMLRRADVALFDAKAGGRGKVSIFAPPMQEALEQQVALTMDLRDTLEAGLLTLAYQPQVDDSGGCFGVEALLRWNHPTRGPIGPMTFIPLAERAGLSGQIDAFVLSAACSTLRRWRDMPELRHLHLSVNIGSQKLDRGVAALVAEAVRAHGIDPTRLTIEITERVMLDNVAEVDFALAALKKLGVRIALDDFGTGYSSLSHLKRLPIDTLKIDRSFVDAIETDANDRVIVQTILNIARNLGVSAIAEGVENEMQALLLRRFGCHAYQGFMYGRPMSLEDVEAYVVADRQPALAVAVASLRAV